MNIPRHSTVIGIIALGMGLIILIGDIDLSVGSALALIGGLTVMVFNVTNNIAISLVFALCLGVVLSLFNGVLVGLLGMPAFIVTLATMLMFRSIAQTVMNKNGWPIYQLDARSSSWMPLFKFGNNSVGVVPIIVLVLIAVVAAVVYMTTSTKFGKKLYALGSNERAAKLTGINTNATRVMLFGMAGLLFGIAAFIYVAYNGSVDPATSGKNYELYAIAGVVIGGISMQGGRGQMLGVIFGSMSFTMIEKIITAIGWPVLLNDTVKGAILIVAIFIQVLPRLLESRGRKLSLAPAAGAAAAQGTSEDAAAEGDEEG
jgi:ribose transport system permease protein